MVLVVAALLALAPVHLSRGEPLLTHGTVVVHGDAE
jgi:hypothetical protein